jgi:large subunit ribosomal protein L17
MVTLGKKGSLHARRTALAVLRQKDAVKKLFDDIAPRSASRNGGYTRIIKLGQRRSDAAPVAFLEWVDAPQIEHEEPVTKEKGKKARGAKSAAEPKSSKKAKKGEPNEKKTGDE